MNDVVITGAGMVTANGFGLEHHWQLLMSGALDMSTRADYSLDDFQAAPFLTDRRMLKAVSQPDAIGLAALEGLAKDAKLAAGAVPPERFGLYVGAPPASAFDNEFYADAMRSAMIDGKVSDKQFGKACMSSRPTALLIGLPNNVLCYGAMVLDARGPNSNYTQGATSGMMAVINGARRVRRGQIDAAVAGGFAAHTEPVNYRIYDSMGYLRPEEDRDSAVGLDAVERRAAPYHIRPFAAAGQTGTIIADGAAFVALESQSGAAQRGAKTLATYISGALTADGMGPARFDRDGHALQRAIEQALAQGGVAARDVGLVLACASGIPDVDQVELSVLSRVLAKARDLPALGCSSRVFGNLMEAGGVADLALVPLLFATGEIPATMRAEASDANPFKSPTIDPKKPYALVVRTSPWGEHACIVLRKE